MRSMFSYPKIAVERAMNLQEVILRALANKITWWQANPFPSGNWTNF